MRRGDEGRVPEVEGQLHEQVEETTESHVVFDFTGLGQPDVCDLSLILTARLQSAATDSVWVRSLPWQTARILRILKLDHLFRPYPTATDELN
jgi:anti-anti-sigma regulatory factor